MVVDPITHLDPPSGPELDPSRKRRLCPLLPRRTPPQPAAGNARAQDVNGRQADFAPGLDGCRVINDDEETWPTPPSPVSVKGAGTRRDSTLTLEEGLSQWDGLAAHPHQDEELYGEALELRIGKYREKLKRDVRQSLGFSFHPLTFSLSLSLSPCVYIDLSTRRRLVCSVRIRPKGGTAR